MSGIEGTEKDMEFDMKAYLEMEGRRWSEASIITMMLKAAISGDDRFVAGCKITKLMDLIDNNVEDTTARIKAVAVAMEDREEPEIDDYPSHQGPDPVTGLRPCPFCGGRATVYGTGPLSRVFCTRCHVTTEVYDDSEKAIDGWNTRCE